MLTYFRRNTRNPPNQWLKIHQNSEHAQFVQQCRPAPSSVEGRKGVPPRVSRGKEGSRMEGGRTKLESWSATLGAGGRGVMRAAGKYLRFFLDELFFYDFLENVLQNRLNFIKARVWGRSIVRKKKI